MMYVLTRVWGAEGGPDYVQVEITPERARAYLEMMKKVQELKAVNSRILALTMRMDDPYPVWVSTTYYDEPAFTEEIEDRLCEEECIFLEAPLQVQQPQSVSGDLVMVYTDAVVFVTYGNYDGTSYYSYEILNGLLEQIAEGTLLSKTLQK